MTDIGATKSKEDEGKLDDGAVYDLCPVHWQGAERIYAVLARRARRARLREQRRARRA